jgi:hypothetical protein
MRGRRVDAGLDGISVGLAATSAFRQAPSGIATAATSIMDLGKNMGASNRSYLGREL